MTGYDILEKIAFYIHDRGSVYGEVLAERLPSAEYLAAEAKVMRFRRLLERFKLEAHVRVDGVQVSLADAEDMESAYATLAADGLGPARNDLRPIIEAAYKLPLDDD